MLKRISATVRVLDLLSLRNHLILADLEKGLCYIEGPIDLLSLRNHLILADVEKGLCNTEGLRPSVLKEPPDPGRC
jgi:hypothetical protein